MIEDIKLEFLNKLRDKLEFEDEQIYTPNEIIAKIYHLIDKEKFFKSIWIEGEVYNYKVNSSGHIYFSLKDDKSELKCVYFLNRQKNISNFVELKDGKKIRAFGNITVYKKNGNCQLDVIKISEKESIGEILKKIKETYEKLKNEGLFDKERKKKIPQLPINIGIATSLNGAAVRDIIKAARENFPKVNIYIAPCFVQGEKAKESIIKSIKILNNPLYEIDLIILGRGGGSFEDLYTFNDEELIRTIANSNVPIISAVGHEIDRPLCEFASDEVAITPTEAAKKFVPNLQNQIEKLENYITRIEKILKSSLNLYKQKYEFILSRSIWKSPELLFNEYYQYLDEIEQKLKKNLEFLLEKKSHKLNLLEERIKQLNPYSPLKRGYAYVTDMDNKIIKEGKELKENNKIIIHFLKDTVLANVEKIQEKDQ